MTAWRWHLVGDDAVLAELPDADTVARVDAALRAAPVEGVVDVVPAARTVLVRGVARGRGQWGRAVRRVAEAALGAARAAGGGTPGRVTPNGGVAGTGGTGGTGGGGGGTGGGGGGGEGGAGAAPVEIPVVYDGEDLAAVAELTGRSPDEVVSRHLAGRYRVAFGGFMPGFAYLVGLDPVLQVPRLATPRTRVPAGAVAIAGEYAAVYPGPTPGGWRLLGGTDAVMFDPFRDERPALLAPGDAVRFVRARASVLAVPGPAGSAERGARAVRPQGPGIEIVAGGVLTLVEDAGRSGLADVGVPRSGVADPAALRAANHLVGNRADAAVLETVLGGLVVRFGATAAIALVGAPAPAELDDGPVPYGRAVRVSAGATLTLGTPGDGLRTWLAVRGGIDVPAVLGSRSSDVLSALGPPPLAPGDVLPLGHAFDGLPEVAVDSAGDAASDEARHAEEDGAKAAGGETAAGGAVALVATPGPRADWLTPAAWARLSAQEWTVAPASNRVALRLDGPPLGRSRDDELPSEGLVLGAVQVPHDGRPVVFGPDHPVTGGYPVVAVLTAEGIARAAQCRPGDRVRIVVRASAPPDDDGRIAASADTTDADGRDEDHPELGT
ncbi:MAG TPA: urea amidolyase family protein [Cellulomonas sp.]